MLLSRRSMKVEAKKQPAPPNSVKQQTFQKALLTAKPALKRPALPKCQGSTVAQATPVVRSLQRSSVEATALSLQRTRTQGMGENQRLTQVRAAHGHAAESLDLSRSERHGANTEQTKHKVIELISTELNVDRPMPERRAEQAQSIFPIAAAIGNSGQLQSNQATAPPLKADAAAALALIEKIETFVKSQRPGLSLSLHESLGARVEIERRGPKEVSLKFFGGQRSPAPAAIHRIQEMLVARGLKVKDLTVE
jgi:hypothetical protein